MNPRSIGVFDSGLGGLTVLHSIQSLLPHEDLIYVGDTARVPYGSKSPETVTRYSEQIVQFLIEKNVKAIVVACNTASAYAVPQLQQKFSLPILGVLQPGARTAVIKTKNKKIGIIGTEGTIRSQAYQQAIAQLDASVQVVAGACPLFVPLVEEGWFDHKVAEDIANIYLKDLKQSGMDTLILGCTHYPLLKNILAKVLGEGVSLVDSAEATAIELKQLLIAREITAKNTGQVQFYCSDAPEKFSTLAHRFLGYPIQDVGLISF